MGKFRKKFLLTFCVNLFMAFTILVFGPMEIFISNSSDFQFTLADFWWMLSVFAAGYLIASTFIMALLPDKLCEAGSLLIFAFTLCCYVQAMLLNGKMKVLAGREIEWGNRTIVSNILTWFFIFIAVFAARYYLKENGRKIVQFLSLALVVVQLTALISLLITTDVLEEKNSYGYVSNENMLELSGRKNVVVFILDSFDGKIMDTILAEDEKFLSPLQGFTYYPNATSVYSRTYPSVTYLLTGDMCRFDKEAQDYVNEAYDKSGFISTLCANDIEVGLYTFPIYIGDSAKTQMCNYVFKKLKLDFKQVIRICGKMVLYRDMPYLFKSRFEYDVSSINNRVAKYDGLNDAELYQNSNDEWFDGMLTENGISVGEEAGCFRFYHLLSAHANLSNPYPYAKRSLEIVYEYLNMMREMGVYEDSTVIITTDHGFSGGGETLDMPHKTAVPIVFVKPAGVSGPEMQISAAPVSHVDFIPTVLDGFSLDYSDYGRPFYDIEEDEDRERFYYYTALYTDEEGEIELREYKVEGDARSEESYHFTGNKWDIHYSYNIVAPRR